MPVTAPLWSPKSSILAVECTDFDPLIDRWQNQEGLTIRDHVNWLLPLGVKALFDTYFYEANFHSSVPLSNGEQVHSDFSSGTIISPSSAALCPLITHLL
ncbi:MAG: hypothetical protein M5U34_22510 [Chloroflexi bacterium]|nr:hypothetical protein [Chloroflexota bacterium]